MFRRITLCTILVLSLVFLAGCKQEIPSSDAGNWLCENRGGVANFGGRSAGTVVCKDGTAHETEIYREYNRGKDTYSGGYYDYEGNKVTRKEDAS